MKKSIVLINPHHRLGKGIFRAQRTVLPLGLLAIASPLDAEGYSIKLIDQQIDTDWQQSLLTELDHNPVCVGIGVKTGIQILYALEASKLVKQNSDVPVIWGGCHASMMPGQTLENDYVDIVVQGEGEDTFKELVQTLEAKTALCDVRGIWYKDNGQIKSNPERPFIDLNTQPPMAYHLIDVEKYLEFRYAQPYLRFVSSRGCNYRCAFCYNANFNKAKWRTLTAEETVRRIKILKDTYGIKGVLFSDDNFFGSVERVREILEGLIREGIELSLYKLDIRLDILSDLDDDLLELLKKAGCRNFSIGLESGSKRIQKFIKKNLSISKILSINNKLKEFGILPTYTFIMGYPTETITELRETTTLFLQLIKDYPQAVKSLHIYTPFPGTELFDLAVEHGLEVPARLEDWSSFNFRTINLPWLSKERIKLLEMLHFCSIPLEDNSFFNPTIDIHPFYRLLAKIYRPIARWRVKHFYYKFPIDIRLAEWLRLYEKKA